MKIAVIIAAILIIIVAAAFIDQIPKFYKLRNCQGIYWRRKYPNVSKKEIRNFLEIFVSAFAFKNKHRCKFNPDDKVMDIYNAIYPSKFLGGDAMELEELADACKKEYEVDLNEIWNVDLTLGQIYDEIIRKK